MTIQEYLRSLAGKHVAVIGVGVSNTPLIRLLRGADVAVTACDRKDRAALGPLAEELEAMGCALRLGSDYLEDLSADVIFRTPGLHPRFLAAAARGAVITSEMEVFFQVCPCPIFAVTGSDGKTTTTTIIAGLLRAAGRRVHLGGNIGHPLLAETEAIRPEDIAVVELSSFQLMTMEQSPQVAVLTNLAPNHLDIHTDMAEYVAAKANIFLHQGPEGRLITNWDNALTRELAERAPGTVDYFTRDPLHVPQRGCFLKAGTIWYRNGADSRPVLPLEDILLPGVHNVENYMAAICAVQGLADDGAVQTFARTFGGVEHRIELVRECRGVRWYNDSIASSPSRTIAGLRSFDRPVILIAGGKDKGVSYAPLGPVVNDHVKLLILCGATAGVIRRAVEEAANYRGLTILEAEDYPAAVALADSRAQRGDVVLLSPASTSFDRFRNFEERGRAFKELVLALED